MSKKIFIIIIMIISLYLLTGCSIFDKLFGVEIHPEVNVDVSNNDVNGNNNIIINGDVYIIDDKDNTSISIDKENSIETTVTTQVTESSSNISENVQTSSTYIEDEKETISNTQVIDTSNNQKSNSISIYTIILLILIILLSAIPSSIFTIIVNIIILICIFNFDIYDFKSGAFYIVATLIVIFSKSKSYDSIENEGCIKMGADLIVLIAFFISSILRVIQSIISIL